jgi:hypothetical protein
MINNTSDHMTRARATADVVRSRLHLRHLVPGGVPGAEGAQSGGRLVRYPKPWQRLRAPVHCAGRADGLGPQSTCSPGFRDAPRFAPVARVFPGAAPCRSETLTLAPLAPRLGPEIRMGGVASTSSTQARTVTIRMLRTDGFGYPESAQRCSNPFEASVWARFPDLAPRPMSPPRPRIPSTPLRWSRVKGSVSPQTCRRSLVRHQDLAS